MTKGEKGNNFWKLPKKELTIVNDTQTGTRIMTSETSSIYIMCCCCWALLKHS